MCRTDILFLPYLQALLIQEPKWDLPRLLQLPENYNTIFQYYHRKTCTVCTKVPKDPAVCLVCGTFVCLKGLCCKQQSYCECVLVRIDSYTYGQVLTPLLSFDGFLYKTCLKNVQCLFLIDGPRLDSREQFYSPF